MRGGSDNPPLDVEVGGWNASKGMGPLGGKWKYKAGITLGVLGRRSATTDGPSSLYVYYNKGGRQKGGLVNTLRLVQRPHDEEELKATKKVDSLTGPGYYIKTMPNSVGYTRGSRTEEEERFFIAKDAFDEKLSDMEFFPLAVGTRAADIQPLVDGLVEGVALEPDDDWRRALTGFMTLPPKRFKAGIQVDNVPKATLHPDVRRALNAGHFIDQKKGVKFRIGGEEMFFHGVTDQETENCLFSAADLVLQKKTLKFANEYSKSVVDAYSWSKGYIPGWMPDLRRMTMKKIPFQALEVIMLTEWSLDEVMRGVYNITTDESKAHAYNVIWGLYLSGSGGCVVDKFSLYYPGEADEDAKYSLLEGFAFRTGIFEEDQAEQIKKLNKAKEDNEAFRELNIEVDTGEDVIYFTGALSNRFATIEKAIDALKKEERFKDSLKLSFKPEEERRDMTLMESEWELFKSIMRGRWKEETPRTKAEEARRRAEEERKAEEARRRAEKVLSPEMVQVLREREAREVERKKQQEDSIAALARAQEMFFKQAVTELILAKTDDAGDAGDAGDAASMRENMLAALEKGSLSQIKALGIDEDMMKASRLEARPPEEQLQWVDGLKPEEMVLGGMTEMDKAHVKRHIQRSQGKWGEPFGGKKSPDPGPESMFKYGSAPGAQRPPFLPPWVRAKVKLGAEVVPPLEAKELVPRGGKFQESESVRWNMERGQMPEITLRHVVELCTSDDTEPAPPEHLKQLKTVAKTIEQPEADQLARWLSERVAIPIIPVKLKALQLIGKLLEVGSAALRATVGEHCVVAVQKASLFRDRDPNHGDTPAQMIRKEAVNLLKHIA